MKTRLLVMILATNATVAFAQSAIEQINDYFNLIRKNKSASVFSTISNIPQNESSTLSSIIPYTKDSLNEIRYSAYSLVASIAQQTNSFSFRQKAVTTLITGWRDKDSGINGLVGSSLQQFKPGDFDNSAKDSLGTLLKEIPPYYDKLVKLIGYLNMNDQKNIIQSQLQSGLIKSRPYRWAAYLALCRMGDESAMTYVMDRVRKLGINDDVVYEIFPDLVYTRKPDAIRYMVEFIYSDEKNCESANPEANEAIPCGCRILEYLAPIITNFPYKVGASGDLEVKDYKEALAVTRNWFKSHSDFQILTD